MANQSLSPIMARKAASSDKLAEVLESKLGLKHSIIKKANLREEVEFLQHQAYVQFVATKESEHIVVSVFDYSEKIDDTYWTELSERISKIPCSAGTSYKLDRYKRVPEQSWWIRHLVKIVQIVATILGVASTASAIIFAYLNYYNSSHRYYLNPQITSQQVVGGPTAHITAPAYIRPSISTPPQTPTDKSTIIPSVTAPSAKTMDNLEQTLDFYLELQISRIGASHSTNPRLQLSAPLSYYQYNGVASCTIDGGIQTDEGPILSSDKFSELSNVGSSPEDLIRSACEKAIDDMVQRYDEEQ